VTLKTRDKGAVTVKVGQPKDQDYPVQRVGSNDVFVLKKYSVDRFLKKADDLKKTTATTPPPPRPGAPRPPVQVTHHGKAPAAVSKAPAPAKVPTQVKLTAPGKAPAPGRTP
jgi:hypothetical protein